MTLIGRQPEIRLLEKLYSSNKAEFIAMHGRRRIGKTYLIHQVFSKKEIYLECSGIKDGSMEEQLLNFNQSFAATFYSGANLKALSSWHEAFALLTNEVKKLPKTKKIVVFLDELPWLATDKSSLMQHLDHVWNTEWSRLPNFKLIVCGSAASWMLDNLINAKGGLHNRITQSIRLGPFDLAETQEFLEYKKIKLSPRQVLDIYIAIGGVPYYLNQLDNKRSFVQIINELCFTREGLLYEEFPRLFRSLFDNAELNLRIVKEIGQKRYGISFAELVEKTGKKAGGRFADRLEELEASGFIQGFLPYGKKQRGRYYKLADPYVAFYLKWIAPFADSKTIPHGAEYYSNLISSPAWSAWAGYSFESICYSHIDKIIKTLKLSGLSCRISDWRHSSSAEEGAQIDLVIDRSDGAITLCEIKYSKEPFVIDKTETKALMKKQDIFERQIKGHKQIFWAIITSDDFKHNMWSDDLINGVVELKDLFQKK